MHSKPTPRKFIIFFYLFFLPFALPACESSPESTPAEEPPTTQVVPCQQVTVGDGSANASCRMDTDCDSGNCDNSSPSSPCTCVGGALEVLIDNR